MKDKLEQQVTHTYALIEAKKFSWKRQNETEKRENLSDKEF